MGYVALERLRWGDGWIEPGQPVPADEPGRNYDNAVYLGQIARVPSDDDPEPVNAYPAWGPDPEPEVVVESEPEPELEPEPEPEPPAEPEPPVETEPELEADDAAKAAAEAAAC
jgi:hypothetical protein